MANRSENNFISVTIPEGITFTIPLAGPVVRSCAAIVDILIITAFTGSLMQLISFLSIISQDLFGFVAIILQFILSSGYGIFTEWLMNGQTFGKRFFHIRVIDCSGLPLQLYQVILRNILRPIDQLPLFYLTGGLTCFFSRHFQRLGDHVANTVVIISRTMDSTDIPEFKKSKYNSIIHVPHLAARIRQVVTPEQRTIAVDALSRATAFDPEARIEIFKALATTFKTSCNLPPEYTDGIPDEILVADIVEVLYGSKRVD
jgi:uncharacterized RDD family membrane protein YckC